MTRRTVTIILHLNFHWKFRSFARAQRDVEIYVTFNRFLRGKILYNEPQRTYIRTYIVNFKVQVGIGNGRDARHRRMAGCRKTNTAAELVAFLNFDFIFLCCFATLSLSLSLSTFLLALVSSQPAPNFSALPHSKISRRVCWVKNYPIPRDSLLEVRNAFSWVMAEEISYNSHGWAWISLALFRLHDVHELRDLQR